MQRERLSRAYGEWLDTFEWHWFATLTFRLPPSPRTSLNHFRRLLRYLENDLGGIRPGYFVGSETGGWGGREHLHVLLRIPPGPGEDLFLTPAGRRDLHRTKAWRWWKDHYGRATISPVKDHEKASHYVTKYCTKSLAEWDIGGNYGHQKVDQGPQQGRGGQ